MPRKPTMQTLPSGVKVRSIHATTVLPLVRHTEPCKECPFRRTSTPGWLGGATVDSWVHDLQFGETAFVCHTAERQRGGPIPAYCAGSMIFWRNTLKLPRNPQFFEALSRFKTDTVLVFEWPGEFEEHHANGILALRE